MQACPPHHGQTVELTSPSSEHAASSSGALTCIRPIQSQLVALPIRDMSSPQFFQQPLRYLRWASHERPAIFYSFVIGAGGPLSILVAPPIRRFFNDGPREKIPMTYPSKLHWTEPVELDPCQFLTQLIPQYSTLRAEEDTRWIRRLDRRRHYT